MERILDNTFLLIIFVILFVFFCIILYICVSIFKKYEEKGLLSKIEQEKLRQNKLEEEKLAREFKEFNKGLPNN